MNLFEETKFILKKYGVYANKKLGQNFLINEDVIDNIVSSANISREDLVIEIGPGLGTLTNKLLETAGKVICVELDTRMIKILNDRFKSYDNFELINDDILKVNLQQIIKNNVEVFYNICSSGTIGQPEKINTKTVEEIHTGESKKLKHVKIVANLPYYITTPIIMKLIEEELAIESIIVMIQKEVADRLIAIPGTKNSGAISYTVYYYAEAQKIIDVENNSFIPEPNVTSSVIKLNIRKNPPIELENKNLMFKIIKQAFMQRRKTLINALTNMDLFESKEQLINMLKKLGINEKVRGESLSIEEFAKIANYINSSNRA